MGHPDGTARHTPENARALCIRVEKALEAAGCADDMIAPACVVTYDNRVQVALDLRRHVCDSRGASVAIRAVKALTRSPGSRDTCSQCAAGMDPEEQRRRITVLYPRMVKVLSREAQIIYRYPRDGYPFRVMLDI